MKKSESACTGSQDRTCSGRSGTLKLSTAGFLDRENGDPLPTAGMNRKATGQPKKGQNKYTKAHKGAQSKMAPAGGGTRGGSGHAADGSQQMDPSEAQLALIRDPFLSQSLGDQDSSNQGESLSQPPSADVYRDVQEPADSPVSSMDRNMDEITEAIFSQSSPANILPQSAHYSGNAVLLARFCTMLQQELSKACTMINTNLKRDIHSLGERFVMIETKVDKIIKKVNQNSNMITDLQDRLEEAYTKIEDLENNSRRYNVRIQWSF